MILEFESSPDRVEVGSHAGPNGANGRTVELKGFVQDHQQINKAVYVMISAEDSVLGNPIDKTFRVTLEEVTE